MDTIPETESGLNPASSAVSVVNLQTDIAALALAVLDTYWFRRTARGKPACRYCARELPSHDTACPVIIALTYADETGGAA